MKKYMTLPLLALSLQAGAQCIDLNTLQEFRQQIKHDDAFSLRQNALIQESSLRDRALNHALQAEVDHFFKYKVEVQGITDQQQSGRCWMFTSLNVLRPAIMKKYDISSFDFSHNYLYFYDLLEKSNLFLENIIATSDKDINEREVVHYFKDPASDGGVWNLFYNLGTKYGFVPKEVMPETYHSEHTSQLRSLLCELLRRSGYELREQAQAGAKEAELRQTKEATLAQVYKLLSLTLGEPPTAFTWRYTDKQGKLQTLTTTPQAFYEANTPEQYSPKEYIMIMNDPTRPYYQVYDIANYRNTVEGINWKYLNLPNDEIKQSALESIKNNEAMYASCDVGKQFNRKSGVLDPSMYDYETLLGIELEMDKKARILTRQSGSAHAMAIVAVDTDEQDKPTKWEFENSWGAQAGHKGYLTFTDQWFDEYLFRIVIRKEYLSPKAVKALRKKPVQLPAWDYMF